MNTVIDESHTRRGGRFFMGFVAGGAIGAGLALCFAPRLTAEWRRRMTDSATDLQNAASDGVQAVANRVADVVDRAADVVDDVTRRGQAVRDDLADVVSRGAHEVGLGARDVARSAGAVERFAKASKTDRRDG